MARETMIAVGVLLGLALMPACASAYLDPGTGSILLQGLIAAVAGIAVAGRIYWDRIKRLFTRKRDGGAPEHEPPDNERDG